jgi:hypothetical protein
LRQAASADARAQNLKLYRPSFKVEKLLNDSRGMKKYLIDYDFLMLSSSQQQQQYPRITKSKTISLNNLSSYKFEDDDNDLINNVDSDDNLFIDKCVSKQQENDCFEMDYFEIEATATNTPISNPTSSDFVSTVIFDDRIVDTIFLSAVVANESNGSFAWYVSTNDGTTWQSVTSLNQFVSVDAGSKVRVKATITRNATVTSLADMPRIESYQFSTKNVITPNDLLPLQVNMLKMGLKLNALGTYSTTEFVKMMVDLFENANNIDASSTATLSSGTYISGGSSATLISLAENTQTNDGVATVTSAIVMAEYTGTVAFYVRRGSGSWGNPITLGEIVQFTQGTPTNEIQIKAEMSPGAVLYGWAYLYQ